MRPEILDLLREAGVCAPDGELPWAHVVLTTSRGSVIHPALPAGADRSERGLHFLVLGESGVSTHHCKCCAASPGGGLHRRAEVIEILSADSRARAHLPRTVTVRNERVELHVAEYFDGRPMSLVLAGPDEERRWAAVGRALDAVAVLSRAWMERTAWVPSREGGCLGELARDTLAALERFGIAAPDRSALAAALAAQRTVPRVAQHGDFWPSNVLVSRQGEIRILDFDHFGELDVPLYDVLHFLRTLDDLTPSDGAGVWVDRMLGSQAPGPASRAVLARERERWGLDRRCVGACVLFYLAHVAVRTKIRGGWDRFLAEIPAAASRVRTLGSVEAFGEALLGA